EESILILVEEIAGDPIAAYLRAHRKHRIVPISGGDRRRFHAETAHAEGRQLLAVLVEDRGVHPLESLAYAAAIAACFWRMDHPEQREAHFRRAKTVDEDRSLPGFPVFFPSADAKKLSDMRLVSRVAAIHPNANGAHVVGREVLLRQLDVSLRE